MRVKLEPCDIAGVVLRRSAGDWGDACWFYVGAFGRSVSVEGLPPWLMPAGRGYDGEPCARELRATVGDGFWQLALFASAPDEWRSKGRRFWSARGFLPWAEWEFVGHWVLGVKGGWIPSERKAERSEYDRPCEWYLMVRDYDGEEIPVKLHFERRRWKKGRGLFKWLRWFVPDRSSTQMAIEFGREFGPKKGTWKGGTMGHSIESDPDTVELDDLGALVIKSMKRYCAEHGGEVIGFPDRAGIEFLRIQAEREARWKEAQKGAQVA